MFKVKWYGFPKDQATIEPSKNIPKFIQNYYKDKTKFGKTLPNPRIKHTKKLTDGTNYHFLSWEGEKGGSWLKEDFFLTTNRYDESEILMDLPELTCGTRKSRDKRICRWNVGIFLGAYPCGIVPLWDELFGSESISQVYGVFIEYLSELPLEAREKLTDLIYDDNFHLARFGMNKEREQIEMK